MTIREIYLDSYLMNAVCNTNKYISKTELPSIDLRNLDSDSDESIDLRNLGSDSDGKDEKERIDRYAQSRGLISGDECIVHSMDAATYFYGGMGNSINTVDSDSDGKDNKDNKEYIITGTGTNGRRIDRYIQDLTEWAADQKDGDIKTYKGLKVLKMTPYVSPDGWLGMNTVFEGLRSVKTKRYGLGVAVKSKPVALDITKPVMTREGNPAEIYNTNAKHPDYVYIGVYEKNDGKQYAGSWTVEGKFYAGTVQDSPLDLVNAPPNTEWVNRVR